MKVRVDYSPSSHRNHNQAKNVLVLLGSLLSRGVWFTGTFLALKDFPLILNVESLIESYPNLGLGDLPLDYCVDGDVVR